MGEIESLVFSGTILIIPVVSIGNVPQLAVDLLVHSAGLSRKAMLDHSLLYPFAGSREDAGAPCCGGIATALDVFGDDKITVIQQRSPILPGEKKKFVEKVLLPFIKKGQFREVLVLGSTDASRRNDAEIKGPKEFILSTFQTISGLSEYFSTLKLISGSKKVFPKLFSSGALIPLLEHALCQNVSMTALVMYVMEGDNTEDAKRMARITAKACKLDDLSENLKSPKSWDYLFGKKLKIGFEGGMFW
ncbi:hypothetical protein PNEG_02688 [Pneumocystis murina B123]|uniref:Proteasome assembly chaperone 2 n=1 Tax=Pneumocystis murina (strain B123) TaxID=1069680 RepID=M7NP74_PNEMU|nr:hypothetical protein PNEG_02688 [Pneumocystis murina B123]EMR08906.1 hypothetical protein PNEG_02688 [Pneumocystis murina B123]